MDNSTGMTYNLTYLHDHKDLCNVSICPIEWAQLNYAPSIVGNGIFLGVFAACLAGYIVLGALYRTWGLLIPWIFGLGLEIIGYEARIQLGHNRFKSDPFLEYIVCLTIAPAFLSAGIYLCFSRIIVTYGEHYARFKPRTYTVIFVCSDILALILQAAGGALADIGDNGSSLQNTGINIMIAGLAFQVASLFVFISLCLDFAWRVRKNGAAPDKGLTVFGCSVKHFYAFLFAIALATITIFVRSCFRVAELKGGFNGTLANNQVLFMVLEGAMVSIAAIAVTLLHPGPVFKDCWKMRVARERLSGLSENLYIEEKVNTRAK